jgi:hypothetical protein
MPIAVTWTLLAVSPAAPPPITRNGARDAAHRELSKLIYAKERPSLTTRILRAIGRWFRDLLDHLLSVTPGRGLGAVVLLVAIVVAAIVVRRYLGPVASTAVPAVPHLADATRSATQLRRDADNLAAAGQYAEAVRDRLRALVRMLEDQGVLDYRPGRTADEVAREAAPAIGARADQLRACTRDFDEIWYGGRPAGPDDYDRLRELDSALSRRTAVPA